MRSLMWMPLVLFACGPPAPGAAESPPHGESEPAQREPGQATPDGQAAAEAQAAVGQGAGPAEGATSLPSAARAPVLVSDSDPPGITPLDEAERTEVQSRCGALMELVKKAAVRDGRKREPHEYVEALADNPPTVAGVDVPRCTELLIRDVRAYRARTLEAQASTDIKIILVNLAGAMGQGKLCPSAPAVPARLEELKAGPHRAEPAVWQAPGWKCVRYDRHGQPQHFQYRLETDAAKQSYRISARGYLVKGQPPVELFIEGKVEGGAIHPSSAIYRR